MTTGGSCGKLRGGEVAEWTNAAVSKTVMSAAPASGVQIPPSPLRSGFVVGETAHAPLFSTLRFSTRCASFF